MKRLPYFFLSKTSYFSIYSALIVILLLSQATFAWTQTSTIQQTFDYSNSCQQAYHSLLSLRIQEAKQHLATERQQQPTNLLPHLFHNYIDLITTFIREDEQEFQALVANKDERLQLLEQSDKSSPYYRYCKAEINLQWAVARIKYEQYWKAFWEVRKAYKLLQENQRLFPDFYPNLKSLGIIHALIGTVPDKYKWGVKILGLNGSIEQGMKELTQFLQQAKSGDQQFYAEGQLIHIFFLFYLQNQPQQAWQKAQQLPIKNHVLNTLVAANMAFRTGHNDQAIAYLEHRPKGEAYFPFPLLDYLLGSFKLHRLDKDAYLLLEKFVTVFKGKHYIKDAYQKLAWHYWLQGDEQKAKSCLQQCLAKGAKMMDVDKQAYKNAEAQHFPHPKLLKARLLFDGGYYTKALAMLQQHNITDFEQLQQQVEFVYRSGRIEEKLGHTQQAIQHYLETINKSKSLNTYFAPKACLQLGKIYEQQKELTQARFYYKKCLSYQNYSYKSSFDQQAKAGLNRVRS